jgi:hypothetical protein
MARIPDDRPLSTQEESLTRWLLEHGEPGASDHLGELRQARVVGRCGCGCASVDFAINGVEAPTGVGLEILSDYQWCDSSGREAGIFVFARGGQLAGLEVYTLHPDAATDHLPSPAQLEPFGKEA